MNTKTKDDASFDTGEKIVNFQLKSAKNAIFFTRKKILEEWKNSSSKENFFLAKDNFWTKDLPTTSSSFFLRDFFVPEDATVITKLKNDGFFLLGKTTLDEFACGGTGLFAAQGAIYNPLNEKHLVGGSSSGSAASVVAEIVPFALGHDTGDSLRRPASYCGIFGFKPSYGLVSRYGVIPMAASLDTVGLLSRDLTVMKKIYGLISFPDERDLVTMSAWKKGMVSLNEKSIAVIEGVEKYLSEEYANLYLEGVEKLHKIGYRINTVNFPAQLREHLQITYLVICSSELVSHLNALQGITFAERESFREKTIDAQRNELVGKWVKERIILGSYFLENHEVMIRARKMRNLIKKWTEEVFSTNSFLVFPGTISAAPKVEDFDTEAVLSKSSWVDNLLLLANFSGSPSINIPLGTENGMPVSLNIDSHWGNDNELLKAAETFSKTVKENRK